MKAAKTLEHLLLLSPFSSCLWCSTLEFLGLSWVMPSSVAKDIWVWQGIWSYSCMKKFISLIPLVNFWVISKKKKRAFEGFESPSSRVWDVGLQTLSFLSKGSS